MAIVRRELGIRRAVEFAGLALAGFAVDALLRSMTPNATAIVALIALVPAVGVTLGVNVGDGTYFAAPLYGRQLARAHALVALAGASIFPFGAMLDWAVRGTLAFELGPRGFAVPLLCACAVAALVALSATLRKGAAQMSYALLAIGAGTVTLSPALAHLDDGPLASFLLASALGFFALRVFGETLARYDPI